MKTASMVLLVSLGAVACGGESEVQRGIYKLEVVKQSDTCTPARMSGDLGEASIDRRAEGPFITIPQGELRGMSANHVWAYASMTVPEDTGFTRDLKAPNCDTGVEHDSLEWLSERNPLEVRYKRSWTGMAGCAQGTGFSDWPEADCASEAILRYTRVEACPETCKLTSTWDVEHPIHYTCDCG